MTHRVIRLMLFERRITHERHEPPVTVIEPTRGSIGRVPITNKRSHP